MSSLKAFLHTDRFMSCLLICLAVMAYGLLGGTEEVYEPGEIKASTYPRLILVGLMIACALQIVRGSAGRVSHATFALKGLISIGLVAVYIVLLDPVGYYVLTPVVLVALPVLSGFRDYKTIAVSTTLVTVALYIVFGMILGIPLPAGLLVGLTGGV